MMDLQTIRQLNAEAAAKAARLHKRPTTFSLVEVDALQAGDIRHARTISHIGDLVPDGWERVDINAEFGSDQPGVNQGDADGFGAYFVDSSGFGEEGEPALTFPQFADQVRPGYGYAIVEAGQFQVKIGMFRRAT